MNDWFEIASSNADINPRYTANFKEYLWDACFQDVQEEVYDIPIGEWPDDPSKLFVTKGIENEISLLIVCMSMFVTEQKEFGYLYREQQKTLFKSMKRWWLDEIHITSEDYDRVCQEALSEFDDYHSFSRWRVFTARKPL